MDLFVAGFEGNVNRPNLKPNINYGNINGLTVTLDAELQMHVKLKPKRSDINIVGSGIPFAGFYDETKYINYSDDANKLNMAPRVCIIEDEYISPVYYVCCKDDLDAIYSPFTAERIYRQSNTDLTVKGCPGYLKCDTNGCRGSGLYQRANYKNKS